MKYENPPTDLIGAVATGAKIDEGPTWTAPTLSAVTVDAAFGLSVANFLQFCMLFCNSRFVSIANTKMEEDNGEMSNGN